ncbi:ABC transporter permease [Natronomonas sp.]|uniref:ABC transporter permease n=1 Tax=Natronomonas sp. TaxID=2184060 RepID=UPI003975E5C7
MAADGDSRVRHPSRLDRRLRQRLRALPIAVPRPATVAAVLVVLVGWQLLSLRFPDYRFPGLATLAGNVVVVISGETPFEPLVQYGATIARVSIGFAVSMVLATLWGVAMGSRDALRGYLSGPLFVLLTVPSVVWAFVGVIWFGLTEFLVPVFVVVLVVFPYLTVTVWEGMGDVDESLLEMAAAFGASRRAIWRDVYLPQLRPYLFGIARVGLAVSWKLCLVAEVFGSATGVGVAVKYHFESFENGMVIAWALPMMAVIYGADRLLRRLERRATRWQPDSEATDVRGMIE